MVGHLNGRTRVTTTSTSEPLSLAAAARRCKVATQTVRMWILTGRLKAVLVDGAYNIDVAELDRVYREVVATSPQMAHRRGK